MKILIVSIITFFAATSCYADAKTESACTETQLETYFDAQSAFANDDLVGAQTAAKSLIDLAAEKGCSLDGKECCAAELEAAETIANTTNIAAARKAFKNWSGTILAKIEESGVPEGSVYRMHCPMAFGNTGGTWLQNSNDLRNPYYGAMMLKCGMQQTVYGKAE